MKGHKFYRLLVLIITSFILVTLVRGLWIYKRYQTKEMNASHTMSICQPPFYNDETVIDIFVDKNPITLSLWWEGLTGTVDIAVKDEIGITYLHSEGAKNDFKENLPLKTGAYKIIVKMNQFTGACKLGYDQATPIIKFPNKQFSIIQGSEKEAFYWDYLLYIPEKVIKNHLLVMPNNTGDVSDQMVVHRESAKEELLNHVALADFLGAPMLVPVFPRKDEALYSHSLDRMTLLEGVNEMKRLDLQLVAMIDDARKRINEKEIIVDEKVMLLGFSAAGDFVDRFTVLHPDRVIACVSGGCSNILPVESIGGENLPYPLGIYDYPAIVGKKFDAEAYKKVKRFCFKGANDLGGTVTTDRNGFEEVFSGKDYYKQYEEPLLQNENSKRTAPITKGDVITESELQLIEYRIYKGKILVDRFQLAQSYLKTAGFEANFVVYDGVGHELTEQINDDIAEFLSE